MTGQKDLADFVSIIVSIAFKLANLRLCISFLFAVSLGKGSVEANETEGLIVGPGRRPAQLGWSAGRRNPRFYRGGRFEGRFVSPALAVAAQLRASGNSAAGILYSSTCTSSLKLRRASRARPLPNPCRLSGGEHVLSDTKINGICILL
jgi:hypothetical protein